MERRVREAVESGDVVALRMNEEVGCREVEAVGEVFVVLHERREVRGRVVAVVVVRHVVPAEARRERRRASMARIEDCRIGDQNQLGMRYWPFDSNTSSQFD